MVRKLPVCSAGNVRCGRICIDPSKRNCNIVISPVGGIIRRRSKRRGVGSRSSPVCHGATHRCYGGKLGTYCIRDGYVCGGRPRRGPRAGLKRRTPRYCADNSRRCGLSCVLRSRKCHKPVMYV